MACHDPAGLEETRAAEPTHPRDGALLPWATLPLSCGVSRAGQSHVEGLCAFTERLFLET